MSKYGVYSGAYFSVFSPNAGKYGPEKTPYLDTFHAVLLNPHISNEADNPPYRMCGKKGKTVQCTALLCATL